LGLKIVLADIDEANLKKTSKEISAIVGDANVLVVVTDVSKLDDVVKLREKVYEAWGEVRLRSQRAHYPLCIPHIPNYIPHRPPLLVLSWTLP
jgi:NADP-dependent 3-hydroxy acid dehydrogenase YdfG